MPRLFKRRADDHRRLRLVRQADAPGDGEPVQKVLHVERQHTRALLVAEGEGVVLPVDDRVARGGRGGQPCAPHGEGAHGTFRLFPALVEVQKRDGVEPHVPIVVDRQGDSVVVVRDEVVVPLLDARGPGADGGAVIDRQEPLGVARLAEIARRVEQRRAAGDFMLHGASLPM